MSRLVVPSVTIASPINNGASTTIIGRGLRAYDRVMVEADLVGTSAGTLDVCLQRSFDGSTFSDWARFKQLAAGAAAVTYNVSPVDTGDIVPVGRSATAITIGPDKIVGGPVGDQLRVLMVGAGGTCGSANQTFRVHAWSADK